MTTRRDVRQLATVVCLGVMLTGCAGLRGPRGAKEPWQGVHVGLSGRGDLPLLHRAIEEVFAPKGVNTLVLEVDYKFQYESHPELAQSGGMTKEDARELAALCRAHGIRLIPQFQCFGHQGHRPNIFLKNYPQLMAPPSPDYDDSLHYQVSWNPLDPKTNEIVFALFDELIEAFEPEAFHVGLDEVFLFPDETTPYYHGESHAEVFAKVVNDLHDYLVKKKGLTMLMWGDRLLDCAEMPYSRFEASDLGTAEAIDAIPKDIILCDWHYIRMRDYPSVRHFQEKGFRVWPTSWRAPSAALALWECAHKDATDRMLGHLCSSWCGTAPFCQAVLGENVENLSRNAQRAAETFHAVADVWRKVPLAQ